MSSNPDYLAARQEWLERYGSYIAQARRDRYPKKVATSTRWTRCVSEPNTKSRT